MTDPLTIFDCSLCDWSPYHIWLFHIWLFSIGPIPSLPLTIFNLPNPLITFNCFQFDRSLYCLRLFLLFDWSPYYLQLYSIWLITLLLLTISYIADPLITFDCFLYDPSPYYLWLLLSACSSASSWAVTGSHTTWPSTGHVGWECSSQLSMQSLWN